MCASSIIGSIRAHDDAITAPILSHLAKGYIEAYCSVYLLCETLHPLCVLSMHSL